MFILIILTFVSKQIKQVNQIINKNIIKSIAKARKYSIYVFLLLIYVNMLKIYRFDHSFEIESCTKKLIIDYVRIYCYEAEIFFYHFVTVNRHKCH